MTNEKNNFSAILISAVALIFFAYLAMVMFNQHASLKAFSMITIVVLFGVNIWTQITKRSNSTQTLQWIFILVAIIFWMAHSLIFGRLSHIV